MNTIEMAIKELKERDKEIERLTAESTEWESKCYKYQDIIEEVREYIEQFIDAQKNFYPYVDLRVFDLDKILEILDKDSDKE